MYLIGDQVQLMLIGLGTGQAASVIHLSAL